MEIVSNDFSAELAYEVVEGKRLSRFRDAVVWIKDLAKKWPELGFDWLEHGDIYQLELNQFDAFRERLGVFEKDYKAEAYKNAQTRFLETSKKLNIGRLFTPFSDDEEMPDFDEWVASLPDDQDVKVLLDVYADNVRVDYDSLLQRFCNLLRWELERKPELRQDTRLLEAIVMDGGTAPFADSESLSLDEIRPVLDVVRARCEELGIELQPLMQSL
jgi:hypothetical protein